MDGVATFIVLMFFAIGYNIATKPTKKTKSRNYKKNNYDIPYISPDFGKEEEPEEPDTREFKILPYAKKNFLTMTEYYFYKILKQKCNAANLIICPKVRLEDFIEVTILNDFKNKQRFRGYIKSRHVDFLICDADLHIMAAVELDDNSHNNKKAADTDSFKNRLYKAINLPLFRIRTNQNYDAAITEMITRLTENNTTFQG